MKKNKTESMLLKKTELPKAEANTKLKTTKKMGYELNLNICISNAKQLYIPQPFDPLTGDKLNYERIFIKENYLMKRSDSSFKKIKPFQMIQTNQNFSEQNFFNIINDQNSPRNGVQMNYDLFHKSKADNMRLIRKSLPFQKNFKNIATSGKSRIQRESSSLSLKMFEMNNDVEDFESFNDTLSEYSVDIESELFEEEIDLKNVFLFFKSFLNGKLKNLNKINKFTEIEKTVFECIQKKKNYVGFQRFLKILKTEKDCVSNHIFKLTSSKRKEEKIKYVFRIMGKEMLKNFQKCCGLENCSKDKELHFYQFYFKHFTKSSKTLGDFNEFRFPDFKISKSQTRFKTLNKDYFNRLNLSKEFINDFNQIVIDLICWTLPLYENPHSMVNEKNTKSIDSIIKSVFSTNKNDLLAKINSWKESLNAQSKPTKGVKEIEKKIFKGTFKFPWSMWEIKDAFICTFLSINEQKLESYTLNDYPRDFLKENEKAFKKNILKVNQIRKNGKITTKKKTKFIFDEHKKLINSEEKYFWIGFLNRFDIFKQYQALFPHSTAINFKCSFNKQLFLRKLKMLKNLNQMKFDLKFHLYCIFFNFWFSKFSKSKKYNFQTIFENEKFINFSKEFFSKMCPQMKWNDDLLNQYFFIDLNKLIMDKNSALKVKIKTFLIFISNFHCLIYGLKSNLSIKEIKSFIHKNSHFSDDIQSLKLVLQNLVFME
jgi:hypothetical protein